MNIPVGPKRNTAQNGVPNGVHPILLNHFKELGGGLKYHWQERGLSLFPTLAWGLSWEVQPLDQAGWKRGAGEQEAAGGARPLSIPGLGLRQLNLNSELCY